MLPLCYNKSDADSVNETTCSTTSGKYSPTPRASGTDEYRRKAPAYPDFSPCGIRQSSNFLNCQQNTFTFCTGSFIHNPRHSWKNIVLDKL